MALLNDADDVRLGSALVDKIYRGDTLVWERSSGEPQPSILRLAVSNAGGIYHADYKLENGTFVRQANLATNPGSNTRGVAVSKNSLYMAISVSVAPYVCLYKRVEGAWIRLPDLAVGDQPGGVAGVCAFSNDSSYLIVPHAAAPYLNIYQIGAGDTFTKLTFDPLATSAGNQVAYHPTMDMFVASFSGGSPVLFKKNGATWDKLAAPADPVSAISYGVCFSLDGTLVAAGLGNGPTIALWNVDTTGFKERYTVPALTDSARSVSILAGNTHIHVGHLTSPFHYLLPIDTANKTVGAPVAGLPALSNYCIGCEVSPDGAYLATAHYGIPFCTVFEVSGSTLTVAPRSGANPSNNGLSVAFYRTFT